MTFSKNDDRRVLLIDHDFRRQQLRAAALRNREVEVHPASNIDDAARLWAKRSYDLVLLAAERDSEEAVLLCQELKRSKPRQRMALLIGAPEYIREMGREPRLCPPVDRHLIPTLAVCSAASPRSQWHVMLERLLATG